MTRQGRAPATLLITLLVAIVPAWAAKECPRPQEVVYPDVGEDPKIDFTADSAEVTPEGVSVFRGSVTVRQGFRELEAGEVHYDSRTGHISVDGRATFREPGLEISAEDADFDPATGQAEFFDSTFALPARPARGRADRVTASGKGRVSLEDVRYTTCMDDDPDWELKAETLDLDLRESRGEARKVRLGFQDVPLLYLPYISFPLDDKRKSGFLLPEFRNSDRSGTEIFVPYYWNIAPNKDATVTARWMSERGTQMLGEFRYLTQRSVGQFNMEYLPDDDRYDDDRRFTRWKHLTRYGNHWRTDVDIQEPSDRDYLEDLGTGVSVTSQTHLLRNAQVAYLGDQWDFVARARNYQTVDTGIATEDKPAEALPQLLVSGTWEGPLGLSYDLRSEIVNFARDEGVEGARMTLEPGVRLPVEGPGYFFIPSAAWRLTEYNLDEDTIRGNDTPSVEAPIFGVDAGLLFERDSSTGKYVQTLQPRVLYAYIPRRRQDDIPIFDTGLPDFNYVQLFRQNRFVGGDRIGDTNQVSVGVTTRLLAAETGREFLRATLGQAFYLSDRRVAVPGEPIDDDNESDLVAELGLDIFKNWNADIGYQWDIDGQDTRLAEMRVQYRPASNKVANLSYRYRPGNLEQASASLGWPLTRQWSFVGSVDYSLRDETTLDQMAGLQYESCCWAVRMAYSRQISNRDGSKDTAFMLQLDLKGLAGLGADARKRFERDILGYSVYE
jgi:LPS-assembly protein